MIGYVALFIDGDDVDGGSVDGGGVDGEDDCSDGEADGGVPPLGKGGGDGLGV